MLSPPGMSAGNVKKQRMIILINTVEGGAGILDGTIVVLVIEIGSIRSRIRCRIGLGLICQDVIDLVGFGQWRS